MKRTVFFALGIWMNLSCIAQDPIFSMPWFTTEMNPALSGSDENTRARVTYRNQWPGLANGNVTAYTSLDGKLPKNIGRFGTSFMYDDQASTIKSTISSIDYAYSFLVHQWELIGGLRTTYFQRKLDWDELEGGNQIDPNYGFVYEEDENPAAISSGGMDWSAGLMLKGKYWNVGFATHHLLAPVESLLSSQVLPRKYVVSAEYDWAVQGRPQWMLTPRLIYLHQGSHRSLYGGAELTARGIFGAVYYRHNDALVWNVGYNHKNFRMGYAYDTTVSGLTNKATKGAHEFQLIWKFPPFKKKEEVVE